ncbi:MAG: DUF4926 domain-containing protein [Chloroflexota bacterium]|nr:DUF4926 domain-containing protein [Chloroflexota bacterium]MDE2886193.1 DUF4926 domain-containing protein [Chloroflexota bacterium]
MFEEHDVIVLTADLPKEGLEAGDMGTIVSVYPGKFLVEFMTRTGRTVAIAPVPADQVRAISDFDIDHVRVVTTVGWAGVPSTEDVSLAPVAAGKKRGV